MTLTEFLNLPNPEQALEAAKCFNKKPWDHEWQKGFNASHKCLKCGHQGFDKMPCPLPDPLTLDWNTAKRLQGECERNKFDTALDAVAMALGINQVVWWEESFDYAVHDADPLHYIAACMAAKDYFEATE